MRKEHTIELHSFMDGSFKKKKKEKRKASPNIKLYTVSPFLLLDPTICLMGIGLISIAALEKVFEYQGNYDLAEAIHIGMNILIPCIAFGFIWKLMVTVGGAFL